MTLHYILVPGSCTYLYGFCGHDVVESSEHAQVLVVGFVLLSGLLLQVFPGSRLPLRLLLLDLRHVLKQRGNQIMGGNYTARRLEQLNI